MREGSGGTEFDGCQTDVKNETGYQKRTESMNLTDYEQELFYVESFMVVWYGGGIAHPGMHR